MFSQLFADVRDGEDILRAFAGILLMSIGFVLMVAAVLLTTGAWATGRLLALPPLGVAAFFFWIAATSFAVISEDTDTGNMVSLLLWSAVVVSGALLTVAGVLLGVDSRAFRLRRSLAAVLAALCFAPWAVLFGPIGLALNILMFMLLVMSLVQLRRTAAGP